MERGLRVETDFESSLKKTIEWYLSTSKRDDPTIQ